ncbi:unnamed protein product, partial [Phaeothamnion confervicola]
MRAVGAISAAGFTVLHMPFHSRLHIQQGLAKCKGESPNFKFRFPLPLRGGERAPVGALNASKSDAELLRSPSLQLPALDGPAQLIIVSALYGSLGVALRYLFMRPGPPTASSLSLIRGAIAAAVFVPFIAYHERPSERQRLGTETLPVPKQWRFWLAAAELALWNFGAQGLLNVGLITTPASRAAFLAQSSVVITPALSLLAGQPVAGVVAISCLVALAGLLLLALAPATDAAGLFSGSGGGSISSGDYFCIGGALCWSLYIARLGRFSARDDLPPVRLQYSKTVLLAGFYGVWALTDLFPIAHAAYSNAVATAAAASGAAAGGGVAAALMAAWSAIAAAAAAAWPGAADPAAWVLLVYSAVGPGVLADLLQAAGQKTVRAATANILLAAEPVWAAALGAALLGE